MEGEVRYDPMKVTSTAIPDVLLLELEYFDDDRGRFVRHWDAGLWAAYDVGPFVQDNVSHSGPRVLRGLHFQTKAPQGKLVSVVAGPGAGRSNAHVQGERIGGSVGASHDELLRSCFSAEPG